MNFAPKIVYLFELIIYNQVTKCEYMIITHVVQFSKSVAAYACEQELQKRSTDVGVNPWSTGFCLQPKEEN